MEIRINLLPPEIRARQEQRQLRRRLIFGGFCLLAVFLVFYGSLFIATLKTKSEVSHVKESRLALEKEMEGFSTYLELQSQLANAKNVAEAAVGESQEWTKILRDIGKSMPPAVWLTDLSISPAKDDKAFDGTIGFNGFAHNQGDLSRWLKELEQIQGLSEVRCQYTRQTQSGGLYMQQFEIQALLTQKESDKDGE